MIEHRDYKSDYTPQQTKSQMLYDLIAEVSDEDCAISELQDMDIE
jgi:hypothetical protein